MIAFPFQCGSIDFTSRATHIRAIPFLPGAVPISIPAIPIQFNSSHFRLPALLLFSAADRCCWVHLIATAFPGYSDPKLRFAPPTPCVSKLFQFSACPCISNSVLFSAFPTQGISFQILCVSLLCFSIHGKSVSTQLNLIQYGAIHFPAGSPPSFSVSFHY